MKHITQIKWLSLCLAAVLLLWGVLLVWQQKPQEEMPVLQITDYKVGTVQAVVMQNQTGTVGLMNLPEGILVEGRETALYAQDKLKSLVYTLAHLQASRSIETENPDLSEYGLDAPQAQVSLLLDQDVVRLQLGRSNPLSGEYYLKVDGHPEIWMISQQTGMQLLQSVEDLRDLSLFPAISSDKQTQPLQVALKNPDGSFVLQLLQTDTVSSFYAMVDPVTTALDWERVDSRVMNPLKELQPVRFVSDDVPLSAYGLEEPEYLLALVYEDRMYRCGFVPRDEESWYCANLDTNLVSLITVDQAAFLETDFLDLIGNSIYSQSLADVSRITMRWPEGGFSLDIEGYFTELTGIAENVQLDYLQLSEFYAKIDSIPAAAVLGTEEIPQGTPLLTLSVSLRSGQENILEFYTISDRQCAVYVDGVAEFSTYLTVVRDMIAAAQAIG